MKKRHQPKKLDQNQVAAFNSDFDTHKGTGHEMCVEFENYNNQENSLVRLYQDIMQCEENQAKSVYLLLIDVVIEIAPLEPLN